MYIYALVDPVMNMVWYVGQTNNPKRRIKEHLSESSNPTTQVSQWVAKMKAAGITPRLNILEKCADELAGEREEYWIGHYLSQNTGLKNSDLVPSDRRKEWTPVAGTGLQGDDSGNVRMMTAWGWVVLPVPISCVSYAS